MLLETISEPWRRIRSVNATDNGFPSRVPTLTKPSGIGDSAAQATASAVLDFSGGAVTQNTLAIKPFGAGSNDNTFSLRVIGWTLILGNQSPTARDVWDPTDLCELACTLTSTITGVAGGIVTATDLFADTIALTGSTANDDVDISIVSPANNRAGHVTLDFKGFQLIEMIFTTGGSATSCNALVRKL